MHIGSTISHYKIVEKLGEGGMGVVYKAQDTTLDRPVALKFLADHLLNDEEAKERFLREAKAAAALHHPNVCPVHEIGEADGKTFLAMAFLEGESLEARIAKGPLSIKDALDIARQVAEGLEAAHEKGIVHRDIKPANVMVDTKGHATIMDFGLARLTEASRLTKMDTAMGTVAYMSPEQAQGMDVDSRSDIWSLGCVIYEMVSGQRPFKGVYDQALLYEIVHEEVAPLTSIRAGVPMELEFIVGKCLAKDRKDRTATAQEVGRELRTLAEKMKSGRSTIIRTAQMTGAVPATMTAGQTVNPAATLPPGAVMVGKRRLQAVYGLAGVLAVALLGLSAVYFSATPPAQSPMRMSVTLPANRPVATGWFPGRSLALSPDGTQLVYVAGNLEAPTGQPGEHHQLEVRSLGSLAVRDLPGTTGAVQPFFSPDGQWIGFFTREGELKKVSLAGGAPVTVMSKINGARWAFGVWTADNAIIFATPTAGLQRVSADGGDATALTTPDAAQGEVHFFPALVPSGRAALFEVRHRRGRGSDIEAVMLDSGKRSVVVENAGAPVVLASGHLLFRRGDSMLVAPFDAERLTVTGSAVPLLDSVSFDSDTSTFPAPELAVSRGGTLAYLPAVETTRTLGLVGRDGSFERLPLAPNSFSYPRVSPDGLSIAFTVAKSQEIEVHVYDLARGSTTKLTLDHPLSTAPAWSPDGRSLAVSVREGAPGIYLKNLDGSERLLAALPSGASRLTAPSWSPDGQLLAYTVQTGSRHEIWVLAMGDTPTAKPFHSSTAAEFNPTFSPDGQWLAYQSDESGRIEVYIQRYPQGERLAVSTGGGGGPVWRPDGREIFFWGLSEGVGKMMAVSITPERDTLRLGQPTPLFDLRAPGPGGVTEEYQGGINGGAGYDILPDGKRFVMVRGDATLGTREIVVVQHWFEEFRGREQ